MASADYRLCDICGGKTFYDAKLSYHEKEYEYDVPYLEIGNQQYSNNELNEKHGMCLGSLGDWAVLCIKCSKEYKTEIIKK